MFKPCLVSRCATACICHGSNKILRIAKAPVEILQCAFDHGLEVERFIRRWLEHPVPHQTHALCFPGAGNDRRAVMLDAGIDADPNPQRAIGHDRRCVWINARIPSGEIDKRALTCDEPVLDHTKVLVRPQRPAHLAQPTIVLPRSNRLVVPCHEQAVAGIQADADAGLREATLVQLLQQVASPSKPAYVTVKRHAILRVGGGTISSNKRRLRSQVYAHNSSKHEIVGLAPAALV